MKVPNHLLRTCYLSALLIAAACGGPDTEDPFTSETPEGLGMLEEGLSYTYVADPYAGISEDTFPIASVDLADGVSYEDASGNLVTVSSSTYLSRTGDAEGARCNGILLKWHTSSGNRSACVGRPCKSNPNGEACRVRRNINRYFDRYVRALSVAYCESTLNRLATNGQYHGLYQLSLDIRQTFRIGEGYIIRDNVRVAHAVKNQSGWVPWACKPGWN
jgi:hypothetical protein